MNENEGGGHVVLGGPYTCPLKTKNLRGTRERRDCREDNI